MEPRGRELLRALKDGAGDPGPALVLPVGSPPIALLRPVATHPERLRAADVAALTAWRNRFAAAFLTEFEATEARTRAWLTGPVAANDGKVLFMADTAAGSPFGSLGVAAIVWEDGRGVADAVVRGTGDSPGAMGPALRTLLGWARGSLGLRDLWVRVLSDNPALRFYRGLGFVERRRVPLRREADGTGTRWVEDPAIAGAARALVHLRLEDAA